MKKQSQFIEVLITILGTVWMQVTGIGFYKDLKKQNN